MSVEQFMENFMIDNGLRLSGVGIAVVFVASFVTSTVQASTKLSTGEKEQANRIFLK
ncbi:MAG: hypothetical protein QF757_05495 [Candidatus Marinimicrobia bacterium]|nr:hypothetical protein [Candidatus Neomarinimicrobiota bacterium]